MISINEKIENFRTLLLSCWDTLELLTENDSTGSFLVDWLQVNWELIVEGGVAEKAVVVEAYGDGADCNGASSRVLYPNRAPTHELICSPLNNNIAYDFLGESSIEVINEKLIFDRLVSIGEDGWYYEKPPFDKVLGEYMGELVVVDFNELEIQLRGLN